MVARVQTRVIRFLQVWMETHPNDFKNNVELTRAVAGFTDLVHKMPDQRHEMEAVAFQGKMVELQAHARLPSILHTKHHKKTTFYLKHCIQKTLYICVGWITRIA